MRRVEVLAAAHLPTDARVDRRARSLGDVGLEGRSDRQAHHEVGASVHHEQATPLLSGPERHPPGGAFVADAECGGYEAVARDTARVWLSVG